MKKILFIVFLLTVFNRLDAQQPAGLPFITNYSPVKTHYNGPSTWVLQDRDGMMYFGTWGTKVTMETYDGVSWTPILQSQNIIGHTRAAAIDSSGTIFYGGSGDFGYLSHDSVGEPIGISLLQYVPKDKRNFGDIYSVQATRNSVYLLAGERIFRLTKKISGKRITWVCKTWDSKKGFGHLFFADNTLFVQGEFGLLKLIQDSLQIIPGSDTLDRTPLAAVLPYPGSNGKREFLIVTRRRGLYHFDGIHYTPFHTEADEILKNNATNAAIMVNGNYVLGTYGAGIIILNPQGKVVQIINKQSGLPGNTAFVLYWDGKHNLWAGTDFGICRIEMNSPFTRFFNQPGIASGISGMGSLPDSSLYAGSFGVAKYKAATGLFELAPSLPNGGGIFLPDGNQLILGGGLGLYAVKRGNPVLIQTGIKIDAMLISKQYPNLLCAGTFSAGLAIFIRDNAHAGGWRYLGTVPQTERETIHWIAEQSDGKVWITNDLGNRVSRITLSVDKAGVPDLAKSKVEEFHAGKAFRSEMYAVPFGNKVYFFGDDSTYTLNEASRKFVKDAFLLKSGDTLTGYRLGVNNVLWLLSGKGRYDYLTSTQTDDRYRIDTSAWTLLKDYGTQSIFPDRNGIIWFGALEGLIRFDTKILLDNNFSFDVLIRNITVGKTKLNQFLSGKEAPQIKFSHRVFRFDFAAPYFLVEDETQYQTKLQGFEKNWSAWSKNAFKEYTNLPFGHYVFKVRAKNVLDVVSLEADYAFTIFPPWYRTWWAYVIYAILFGVIVWFFAYLRSRKLQKEKLALEEKVNSRTQELKKSLEELKSTQSQLIQSEKMASLGELTAGIAHEIQNPLNFVNNFSDINKELIEELKTKSEELKIENTDVKDLLNNIEDNSEKINHHGRRADAIVKSMLQHSRTSSGKKEPTDINALADEYLRLSYHGMRAKDKSFNCEMKTEFDETLEKINVVPQDIGRVLLNLFNNAFYACAERSRASAGSANGYVPTVTLVTQRENDHVTITVRDNGNGIPEKIKDKIFQPFFTTKPTGQGTGLGLSLSYDIITKEHNGTIKVESVKGEGTEFTVSLPVQP